jgi:HEAT repeat protein
LDILPLRNPLRGQLISTLIEKLSDKSPTLRYQAAQALGEHGEKAGAALPNLLNALDDPDRKVRYFAAQSIGNVASDPTYAVTKLLAAIRRESDFSPTTISYAAFRSLIKLGLRYPEDVIPHLIQQLDSSNPLFNEKMSDCLLRIGDSYHYQLRRYLDRASRSTNAGLKENVSELVPILEGLRPLRRVGE